MPYSLVKIEDASNEDVNAVSALLSQYNLSQTGAISYHRLVLQLKDSEGQVVGGLVGEMYWDWLFIKFLVVAQALRGQGYGTRLIMAAEEEARANGIGKAWLDTTSFQARPFYERLGYELFGQLEDYPQGHQRYFMKKTLLRTTTSP